MKGLHRPLAACLVAIAWILAAPPPTEAQPLLRGITDPTATYLGSPAVFARIRATQARLVQVYVNWHEVAPDPRPTDWNPTDPADPHYDWTLADRRIVNATKAGLTPVVQIYGAPRWAQQCDRRPAPSTICSPSPGALAAFGKATAVRYDGDFGELPRVRYWDPLNEPNLSLFFTPQYRRGNAVSPVLYRNILNRFSAAVKSVDASNLVVTAGLAPIQARHAVGPLRFARILLCMRGSRHPRPAGRKCGAGVRFDIFAIHPYTSGGPTHHSEGRNGCSLGDLPELRRLLNAADRAGHIRGQFAHTPLWITEFSWDSRPPDPGGLPMRIHARWTAEAMYRAWTAGVSAFFWYGLRDGARDGLPFDESAQSGLYLRGDSLPEDRPKRTLRAFRFPFVALERRHGFLAWGLTPGDRAGRVRIEVRKRRRWVPIAVLRANRAGLFQRVVRTRYGTGGRGAVAAVFEGRRSVPFSLHYVRDFYQPPFG